MSSLKNACFILAAAFLGACSGGDPAQCQTQDSCVNDPACQCWCSVKCGFRDKNDTDSPVWMPNDPNGKFCYCKQRDFDNYSNCQGQSQDPKEPMREPMREPQRQYSK